MTPADLRATLDRLGMSQSGMASLTGRQPQTVRQWSIGRSPVPADVAAWLARLSRWHDKHPPPSR